MRIVITGANGFVAGLLIPRLAARGAELLLVSRNPDQLNVRFPGCMTSDYVALPARAAGFDMLVHLAARNNDQGGDADAFAQGNVVHLVETYRAAAAARVASFIDISTIHALDEGNQSSYAQSKRQGTRALLGETGPEIETVYLATVYGERWSGRLSGLNRLPGRLATWVFTVLRAVKPTVHVDRLVDYLMGPRGAADTLLTDGQAGNPVYRASTRVLGLIAGTAILLGFWWLLIALWAAIRLNSPGPGLFAQQRVGRHGLPFICYKFRTMVTGTRHLGTHEIPAASITTLGRRLRATKADELPQAWNLMRGDMNLIGPRPGLPMQTELVAARTRAGVLDLMPGISGLAQVNGIDMSDPEVLARWDARYMALQSLVLDIKLLIATATGAGRGDPAQRTA